MAPIAEFPESPQPQQHLVGRTISSDSVMPKVSAEKLPLQAKKRRASSADLAERAAAVTSPKLQRHKTSVFVDESLGVSFGRRTRPLLLLAEAQDLRGTVSQLEVTKVCHLGALDSKCVDSAVERAAVDLTGTEGMPVEMPDNEVAELARIADIEHLLHMMNLASEEINALQKLMSGIENTKHQAIQVWASDSARIVKAIGEHRISQAAAHHRQQKLLANARQQVAVASSAFLKASGGPSSDGQRQKLAERHAKQVAEYQSFIKWHASVPPAGLLQSTAPYFEAEVAHLAHVEALRIDEVRCGRQIACAKSRYQDALRGLESISEAEHRARSEAAY